MKKLKIIILMPLLAFASFNCSAPAFIEKADGVNLSAYKTYMWVETRARENDESKRATEYADISMHNAVNNELKNWGWKEVDENADVLVSYDILVERNTTREQEPVYSQPFTRYYYNRYRRRWAAIYFPSRFIGYQEYETPVKEGTITINMMDAKTDKSIWQGWTTENLGRSRITESEIKKSVRNIFKNGK